MKHQGFQYDFTTNELIYLLFRQKKCPKCGSKLIKEKQYESLNGEKLNSRADPLFVTNAKVKHYIYHFVCQKCDYDFSLNELVK